MRKFYLNWLRLFLALMLTTFFSASIFAQNAGVKIAGVVKDKQGVPLIGVSILIKGTTKGTVSDVNGAFILTVPSATTVLSISYIGYIGIDQVAGSGKPLNIVLLDDAKNLNEVVVVGYGTQKRKDITGAVASIDQKRLEDLPNNNISQAIEGSVPGVTISQNASSAEGNDNSILVRGQKSISANTNPLFIVDGVPYNGSLSDINPSDVASIEILKDASSAAIYGSRGSNGVFLITTKKGIAGKPVISYGGSYSFEKLGYIPPVLSPIDFYNYKLARNSGSITPSEQAVYNSGIFPNWIDLTTQNGYRDQNNIAVRGGTDNTKYYVSIGYVKTAGVAVNDNYSRISAKANLDLNITNWLTYGTYTTLSYNDRSGLPSTLSPQFNTDFSPITFNPLTSPFQSDGVTPTIYPWTESNYYANPLYPTLATNSNLTAQALSTNYLLVKFPFLKGLTYKINSGLQYTQGNNNTYYGRNTLTGLKNLGEAHMNSINNKDITLENIIDYTRSFGKHSIAFTALYSYENTLTTGTTLDSFGFPNDVETYYATNLATLNTPGSTYSKTVLLSQMGRLNYSYNSKYLATFTVRRDGFSAFGAGNKYAVFPSVALGWNISNEGFLKDVSALSNLKLRVSYGSNGNQAVNAYSTLAALQTKPYVNGTTTTAGYLVNGLANPNLHWETTNTFNTGVDFGFLNGRINGTIDIYYSQTHDLLLQRSIPSTSGVTSIIQNIGKTSNTGMDVGINTTNLKTSKFSWTSNITFNFNRNKIVDLYGTGKSDTLNNWFIGHPIKGHFGYLYGGVWQIGENFASAPQPNVQAGYAKVIDVNGDGKITPSDKTLIGSLEPKFSWGLGNLFVYKNWSFYAFINAVRGVTKLNGTLQDNVNTLVEKNTFVKNYWTPSNPTNDYYSNANIVTGYLPNIYGVNIYQDASYIRVRDLQLSYKFADALLRKINVTSLKIFAEGRNLYTITSWKGFDPEFSNQTTGGIPLQKELTIGLNVSL